MSVMEDIIHNNTAVKEDLSIGIQVDNSESTDDTDTINIQNDDDNENNNNTEDVTIEKDIIHEEEEEEEETIIKSLSDATLAKEEGNSYYRENDYDNALESYTSAIELCPLENRNELV